MQQFEKKDKFGERTPCRNGGKLRVSKKEDIACRPFWSTCTLSAKIWTFLEREKKGVGRRVNLRMICLVRENKRDIHVKFNKSFGVQ